jgi:hypothetical protein
MRIFNNRAGYTLKYAVRSTSCTPQFDTLHQSSTFQRVINNTSDVDDTLEMGVQSGQAAQLTWIPATGTGDKGAFTGNKLLRKFTLRVDRLTGAGHILQATSLS